MHKRNIIISFLLGLTLVSCSTQKEPAIRDSFPYTIGAALSVDVFTGANPMADSIVTKHYSSIVAENCMKSMNIHPERDRFFWDEADQFVKYGEDRGMEIIGHCLVWHSQCSPWFCVDERDSLVSKEELTTRLREHIHAIVGRYKGRIHGWDVVNEMVEDDGSLRQSQFCKILGEEYIYLALQFAHEADPDAMLFLNDYSMNKPGKRDTYVRIIKEAKKRGLRIDAIGMQSHMGMDYPDWKEFEESIKAYIGSGVKVMFTEVDMNMLPTVFEGANISDKAEYDAKMNPYVKGVPADVSQKWNERMKTFFSIVKKYEKDVIRVCSWGVTDGDSWLNNWPMKGRTNYPLWFDRDGRMKPFMQELMGD